LWAAECIDQETGLKVALVEDRRDREGKDTAQSHLLILEILASNTHPATMPLEGFCMNPREDVWALIATPFYSNGALENILCNGDRKSVLSAVQKSKIIFGVAAGMASLHSRGIIHRDLKPAHVFLDADFEPVIGDFAAAHHHGSGFLIEGEWGTPIYKAPEILIEEDYGFAVDVYAFACTLYSLFAEPGTFENGSTPRSAFALARAVIQGRRYVRKPEIPDYHWNVITRCWEQDPDARPQFRTLVDEFHRDHAYCLEGADLDEVLEYEERVYEVFGEPKENF
jgi:serine/threonine protein kinase